jgi:hypothetical protein
MKFVHFHLNFFSLEREKSQPEPIVVNRDAVDLTNPVFGRNLGTVNMIYAGALSCNKNQFLFS